MFQFDKLIEEIERTKLGNIDSVVEKWFGINSNQLTDGTFLQWVLSQIENETYDSSSTYLHDNGYLKLCLFRSERSAANIRVNFWKPNYYSEENIHNHRWSYSSFIIFGSLENHIYDLDVSNQLSPDETYEEYLYKPRLKTEAYSFKYIGVKKLRNTMKFILPKGTVYFQNSSLFHRARPYAQKKAITLMVVHPEIERKQTTVFSKEPLENVIVPSPKAEKADIYSTIRSFLDDY